MSRYQVLQLFSGGRDSFLSVCRLLNDDITDVVLVTYDNGCCMGVDNIAHEVERLKSKYGDRVRSKGPYNITSVWRQLAAPTMNTSVSDLMYKYDTHGRHFTYSQINCITCRMAMYTHAIALCKTLDIKQISDGARYDQKFAIQQELLLDEIENFLGTNFNIQLRRPVAYVNSDQARKNELIQYGFIPKTLEMQCLIGYPQRQSLSEDAIKGYVLYLKALFDMIPDLVDKLQVQGLREGVTYY